MSRCRKRWIGVLVVLILLSLMFVVREPLLTGCGRWLNVAELPRQTEFVIVLGGGDERRPFAAAALVKQGYAQRVIVATVHMSADEVEGLVLPSHQRLSRVLQDRGVAAEKIMVLDADVFTTYDEAAALREFLGSRPDARVTIVTDDYHTRRSRWIFRRQLGEQADNIYFVAARVDHFSHRNWWRCREGLQAYASEFLKLFYYWCRYGWGLVWAGGTALLVVAIWWRRVVAS